MLQTNEIDATVLKLAPPELCELSTKTYKLTQLYSKGRRSCPSQPTSNGGDICLALQCITDMRSGIPFILGNEGAINLLTSLLLHGTDQIAIPPPSHTHASSTELCKPGYCSVLKNKGKKCTEKQSSSITVVRKEIIKPSLRDKIHFRLSASRQLSFKHIPVVSRHSRYAFMNETTKRP